MEHRVVKVVKVRRVGNSSVITLPRGLEARGYPPGTPVLVQELPDGELRVAPMPPPRIDNPSSPRAWPPPAP